jgi:hypothetical protein
LTVKSWGHILFPIVLPPNEFYFNESVLLHSNSGIFPHPKPPLKLSKSKLTKANQIHARLVSKVGIKHKIDSLTGLIYYAT